MKKYEELRNKAEIKESIEKIRKMGLSSDFMQLFEELVRALYSDDPNDDGIVFAEVDNLYPSVKLENNITEEEQQYVKSFLIKCR